MKSIYLSAVVLLGLAFALGQASGHASGASDTTKQLVYSVCNDSRISPVITERQCDDLQDQTHTEFLCDEGNMLVSNHCWVEAK